MHKDVFKTNIKQLRSNFCYTSHEDGKKKYHNIRLSQKELAKLLHTSQDYISDIENAQTNPSLLFAFEIARLFDQIVDDVFIIDYKKI